MKMLIVVFSIIAIAVLVLWIYGFVQANDYSVKTKTIKNLGYKKVLVIFPHPDDEAQSCAGLISSFTSSGVEVNWVILTKGERGTSDASINEDLKRIRVAESHQAAKIYGIKTLIQKEYPDNDVSSFRKEVTVDLRKIIDDTKPDLIITYDKAGLYGHPDHIVTSEVVSEILKDNTNIKLWYISNPKKLLDQIKLPEQMANDPNFKKNRKYPNQKIWIGISGIVNKIKALYSYKSQFPSFSEGLPIKQIPLWFYISLTPYEYFYQVN